MYISSGLITELLTFKERAIIHLNTKKKSLKVRKIAPQGRFGLKIIAIVSILQRFTLEWAGHLFRALITPSIWITDHIQNINYSATALITSLNAFHLFSFPQCLFKLSWLDSSALKRGNSIWRKEIWVPREGFWGRLLSHHLLPLLPSGKVLTSFGKSICSFAKWA